MKRAYADRRLRIMCLVWLVLFTAAGCTEGAEEAVAKISAPRNQQIPVAGTWEVVGEIKNGVLRQCELLEPWAEKNMQFAEDYALLGSNLLENPLYKIKRVKKEDYLLYGHRVLPQELNPSAQELEIITVLGEGKFLCEMIRLSSESLVLEIDHRNLYLQKKTAQVSPRAALETAERAGSFLAGEDSAYGVQKTGVLVGLCSPVAPSGKPAKETDYYRTFWINVSEQQLAPVLSAKGLFFPRRSGFWSLAVKRITAPGYTEDFLFAHPVTKEGKNVTAEQFAQFLALREAEQRSGHLGRHIRYVGNDYVAIESYNADTAESTLQILPIDSLPGIKPVNIADLCGEAGTISLAEGKNRKNAELEAEGAMLLKEGEQIDSCGLERKMGHWFFKGRINYRKEQQSAFSDYSIKLIPPPELIIYDELSVPWTSVIDRLPEAVDVFTSPNKDLAIVLTEKELVILGIRDGELEKQPLGKVRLQPGETVVMAEWATGSYVAAWENSFRDYSKEEQERDTP